VVISLTDSTSASSAVANFLQLGVFWAEALALRIILWEALTTG